MQKINFKNKPSINSPINADNLNLLQDNVEDAINESISQIKILTAARTATANTATVSYTGVGFKPKFVIALMVADATLYNSKGCTDGTSTKNVYQSAENTYRVNNSLVTYSNYGSWAQSATLSSFDEDGFTLNWTKISNPPSAELQLIFIAMK